MGETTEIVWTDKSFSPWLGCSKVSAGCLNCYGERWAKRSGLVEWGGPRRLTAESTWAKVQRWYEDAKEKGQRIRVFPSLCDPFDPDVPYEWRERFYNLVERTCDAIDWMLLTKRTDQLAEAPATLRGACWVGVTVESGAYAYRVGDLVKAGALHMFLSCEPLIGPLDLRPFLPDWWRNVDGIDLVVVGGESGPHARPLDLDWVRAIRDACAATNTPFMFKQGWGRHPEKLPVLDGRRHIGVLP